MKPLNPADLTELERVTLAVLGAGLVPSAVANDPSFRLDVVIGVSLALLRGEPRDRYLEPDGHQASEAFQRALTDALSALEDRQILSLGSQPAALLVSPGAQPPVPIRSTAIANFNQYPAIFDRYLAGRCLDELLRQAEVYRFIMDRYADSSEIWQRVYQQYT